MEKQQKERISKVLDRLDQVLEDLLEAQFGIEDGDWNKAMNTIEDGFSRAKAFIQRN
nr:hypothetical protein [Candidatus Sigynarchaeum springense]